MNATSLRISVSVSLALATSALIACAAPDSSPDPDESTGQATQALRNCPDGDCPAPTPKAPKPAPTTTTAPPPPPSNPPPAGTKFWWNPGSSSGTVLSPTDYTFTCNDATHQIAYYAPGPVGQPPVLSAEPLCWVIKDCILVAPMAKMVSSSSSGGPLPSGPICSGYTLVSQSYCSAGLTLRCFPLQGTCSCKW